MAENHKEVGDMKMEAEVGPMHLPAKGHRGAHMASGSGGETSYTFPFGLPEGTSPADILVLGFWSPEL